METSRRSHVLILGHLGASKFCVSQHSSDSSAIKSQWVHSILLVHIEISRRYSVLINPKFMYIHRVYTVMYWHPIRYTMTTALSFVCFCLFLAFVVVILILLPRLIPVHVTCRIFSQLVGYKTSWNVFPISSGSPQLLGLTLPRAVSPYSRLRPPQGARILKHLPH